MSPHAVFIEANSFVGAPHWAPAWFVGAAMGKATAAVLSIRELGGQVVEGWRVSDVPGTQAFDPRAAATPIYRQAHIARLRLAPAPAHWMPPTITGRWCVEPGDVVLNKIAPIRAALVAPMARRHPVDGNSLIVRGLPWRSAVWLAACLNLPIYERLLLLESGVLGRVGLKALAALRLPPPPAELDALAPRLQDLLDDQLVVAENVARLKNEADQISAGALPNAANLRAGAFIAARDVSNDSWLPQAAALRAEQAWLAHEAGWQPLRSLAELETGTRLDRLPPGARVLRLGNVRDDLYAAAPAPANAAAGIASGGAHLLGTPLVAGDVLVSTQGGAFRAAYADETVEPASCPSDGWARLRFHETPAAWALMLATPSARAQASRLAVGTARQFVPPAALLSLHLPVPPRELRERWQQSLERLHARRRALDARWRALMRELLALLAAVHGAAAILPEEMLS